ncbi:hypothetical protein RIF25_05245 [Thermosynechococcaceae cyanobacterium BACA0444]|uniref:Uncharacterized protein n=1 Tax=Pseudocalidococcus azoricus BACA0444 TaxID=2918990 RepID=A0AAE4FQB0_9CYAN|nr:hypothetical protein [Pseudocalidococcus azoricus]MDS3860206.1 hypothetical protein [Pseudocalidococcus azoricus BACA0444]
MTLIISQILRLHHRKYLQQLLGQWQTLTFLQITSSPRSVSSPVAE